MHKIANDSGAAKSAWMDVEVPAFDSPVVSGSRTDVCIIGAGIAGLSVAEGLTRLGAHVIVLDDGPIAGGETARSTAHVSNALDDHYYWLESRHGADGARLAAQSHASAIAAIEDNARLIGVDCEFKRIDGFLYAAPHRSQHELERELAAARRAGVAVELVDDAPVPFATGPALRFPDQARFHPVAYCRGLAASIVERGGAIHCGPAAHVAAIEPGGPLEVKLRGGARVFARHVVDATNAAITSMMRMPLRQAAYRSYVIAIAVPAGLIHDALYWDTGDPYHYLRLAPAGDGRDLLIVGGEDHRVGQDDEPSSRWDKLEAWTRERLPEAGPVVRRWSGQIMEPADGLGFIGKNPEVEGVYMVTGDSGNGITHAAIAGLMLPILIAGHDHPWQDLYDPARSTVRSFPTVIREAVSSSFPYTEWLGRGDVRTPDDIPPGCGAVIRRGVHFIAAYRDPEGGLHECSARCSHLSGVVSWNDAEKTWDCPCHGSRFDPYGRVLNPPAIGDLPAAPVVDKEVERERETHLPPATPPPFDRPQARR
jgi:glycine/D-amino acid oxidase-like deaminating enzyme/nitrite reductase/ring-hydroxylating ferredoxin subunit